MGREQELRAAGWGTVGSPRRSADSLRGLEGLSHASASWRSRVVGAVWR